MSSNDNVGRPYNHPRSHSRSASWSYTNSSNAGIPLLSPMRVIRGIVPSFAASGTSSNAASMDLENGSGLTSRGGSRGRADSMNSNSRHTVIDLEDAQPQSPSNRPSNDRVEFYGALTWAEKTLPFILLLLSRIMWDHRLGILVFMGLFGTFMHANHIIKRQVSLKEKRLNRVLLFTVVFLVGNICLIYYVFHRQKLEECLLFGKPNFLRIDVWTSFWCIGITDFVIRFGTMASKALVIIMPRTIIPFRKRGKYFLVLEHLSQFYRTVTPVPQWYFYFTDYNMGGEYFAILSTSLYMLLKIRMMFNKSKELLLALKTFRRDTRYGSTPSKEELLIAGDSCPICQEEMTDPVALRTCKHIFCEDCISMWFDRERTCPMCRANVAQDPLWRDGSTSAQIQLF